MKRKRSTFQSQCRKLQMVFLSLKHKSLTFIKLCVITNWSNLLFSSSLRPGTRWGPVCGARPSSYIYCHHHGKTYSLHTVVQGRNTVDQWFPPEGVATRDIFSLFVFSAEFIFFSCKTLNSLQSNCLLWEWIKHKRFLGINTRQKFADLVALPIKT